MRLNFYLSALCKCYYVFLKSLKVCCQCQLTQLGNLKHTTYPSVPRCSESDDTPESGNLCLPVIFHKGLCLIYFSNNNQTMMSQIRIVSRAPMWLSWLLV